MDSPRPSFSRMRSTVIRVPATTGFPIITLGSETIIGSLIVTLLAVILADSPYPLRESRLMGANAGSERRRRPGLPSALRHSAGRSNRMLDASTSSTFASGSALGPLHRRVRSRPRLHPPADEEAHRK